MKKLVLILIILMGNQCSSNSLDAEKQFLKNISGLYISKKPAKEFTITDGRSFTIDNIIFIFEGAYYHDRGLYKKNNNMYTILTITEQGINATLDTQNTNDIYKNSHRNYQLAVRKTL